MLPSDEYFREQMKKIDLRVTDNIVCYDKLNNNSAMRVFWTLQVFGVQNIRLLNGAFGKWKKEGRPVETGKSDSAFKR